MSGARGQPVAARWAAAAAGPPGRGTSTMPRVRASAEAGGAKCPEARRVAGSRAGTRCRAYCGSLAQVGTLNRSESVSRVLGVRAGPMKATAESPGLGEAQPREGQNQGCCPCFWWSVQEWGSGGPRAPSLSRGQHVEIPARNGGRECDPEEAGAGPEGCSPPWAVRRPPKGVWMGRQHWLCTYGGSGGGAVSGGPWCPGVVQAQARCTDVRAGDTQSLSSPWDALSRRACSPGADGTPSRCSLKWILNSCAAQRAPFSLRSSTGSAGPLPDLL